MAISLGVEEKERKDHQAKNKKPQRAAMGSEKEVKTEEVRQ